jgi:hypothetical protein
LDVIDGSFEGFEGGGVVFFDGGGDRFLRFAVGFEPVEGDGVGALNVDFGGEVSEGMAGNAFEVEFIGGLLSLPSQMTNTSGNAFEVEFIGGQHHFGKVFAGESGALGGTVEGFFDLLFDGTVFAFLTQPL